MNNYKHIIFDIDGTLLDTEYAVLHSLQDTIFDILNKKIDIEELTFALGIPGEVTLNKLGIEENEQANRLWNKYMLKYKSTVKLFDGIVPLIKELEKRNCLLGIITSKNKQEYSNDFAPFGIGQYFKMVLCVEDAPRPKPYADPILKYLEMTGLLRRNRYTSVMPPTITNAP